LLDKHFIAILQFINTQLKRKHSLWKVESWNAGKHFEIIESWNFTLTLVTASAIEDSLLHWKEWSWSCITREFKLKIVVWFIWKFVLTKSIYSRIHKKVLELAWCATNTLHDKSSSSTMK
jgi:hypothetical protein